MPIVKYCIPLFFHNCKHSLDVTLTKLYAVYTKLFRGTMLETSTNGYQVLARKYRPETFADLVGPLRAIAGNGRPIFVWPNCCFVGFYIFNIECNLCIKVVNLRYSTNTKC